jgi:hypothetical protein
MPSKSDSVAALFNTNSVLSNKADERIISPTKLVRTVYTHAPVALRDFLSVCPRLSSFTQRLNDVLIETSASYEDLQFTIENLTLSTVMAVVWHSTIVMMDPVIAQHVITSSFGVRTHSAATPYKRRRKLTLSPEQFLSISRWLCDGLPHGHEWLAVTSIDECATHICETCAYATSVSPDVDAVTTILNDVCIALAEPTLFLARTLMRSNVLNSLMGRALANRVRTYMHCCDFALDHTDRSGTSSADLLRELVSTKAEVVKAQKELDISTNLCISKKDDGSTVVVSDIVGTDLPRRCRAMVDRDANRTLNTAMLLQQSTGTWGIINTLVKADRLLQRLRLGEEMPSWYQALLDTRGFSNASLRRHMINLDLAIDSILKDKLLKASCTT